MLKQLSTAIKLANSVKGVSPRAAHAGLKSAGCLPWLPFRLNSRRTPPPKALCRVFEGALGVRSQARRRLRTEGAKAAVVAVSCDSSPESRSTSVPICEGAPRLARGHVCRLVAPTTSQAGLVRSRTPLAPGQRAWRAVPQERWQGVPRQPARSGQKRRADHP